MKYALPLMSVLGLCAQTADVATKPEFEVASIRVASDDGNHDSDTDRRRFTTHNLTLKRLVAIAYDVDMTLVSGGPNWTDSEGYDINAKIPEEFSKRSPGQAGQMLQSLLAERFHLVTHRESRQIAGYGLVLAKQTPKMAIAQPSESGSDVRSSNNHVTARSVTMEQIARYLSRNRDIAKLVADQTGLKEKYDFELNWTPAQLSSAAGATLDDGASIFTAVQEQLGLKLVPAKIPVLGVVIDQAQRPAGN